MSGISGYSNNGIYDWNNKRFTWEASGASGASETDSLIPWASYASGVSGVSSASGVSGVDETENEDSGNKDLNPKYKDWRDFTYTDGIGNTYDLKKRFVEGNWEYMWGGGIYHDWDSLARAMSENLRQQQPEKKDNKGNPGDYKFDNHNGSFGVTWSLDGNYNPDTGNIYGSSIGVYGGNINTGLDIHVTPGITIVYRF